MNRNVTQLANVILGAFVLVAIFLLYWQVARASSLTSDTILNRTRHIETEHLVRRGQILDRNGTVLAKTERDSEAVRRVYAMPSLAHVLGYHSLRFGDSGIEETFDEYLRGEKGGDVLSLLVNRIVGRPRSGNDVVLTIDARLQKVADEALGNDLGAVVALDPRTGEILAMASHPHYDPNTMDRDWDNIRDNDDKPLLNRVTQGLYAPGSIFKTITLAAALDAGVTQPEERFAYEMKVNERGVNYHEQLIKGFRVYDANHGPTEGQRAVLDLESAFAVSCNVTFADLGLRLGPRRLAESAARFGFDSKLPIELQSSISRLGPEGIAKGDPALAATAFGQGEIQVTPLQMALMTAAVANGGIVPKPFVVSIVRSGDGEVWRAQAEPWRRAANPETARIVANMLITSANEGWAKTGRIPGVIVAAKTGTAETAPGQAPHAWFIAYAPAENPSVAVAVVKEHGGSGGAQAGPPAKAVMEAALRLIPPR